MDDILIFLKAFIESRLYNPKNTAQMRQRNRFFFPIHYGYGLMRIKQPVWITLFRKTPEHIGHLGASGSLEFYAPEPDVYMIGTFNQTDAPRSLISFTLHVLGLIA